MNNPYKPAATGTGSFDLNRPSIISLLNLGGFLTGGLTSLVAVVLAYVWRQESPQPWEASHYTYLLRTFWIVIAASVVGVILSVITFGLAIFLVAPAGLLVAIWAAVRSVMSLIRAQRREPMPDPRTLLA
ncbi:hypothetical protein ABC347_12715 [Sphingomonas sp. 1P06PA]|uniref:DUF4870 family protein n=1 Tax=Sphingomonas sp. 1P06PA TaxID=554121 RepID=UPI0039A4BA37